MRVKSTCIVRRILCNPNPIPQLANSICMLPFYSANHSITKSLLCTTSLWRADSGKKTLPISPLLICLFLGPKEFSREGCQEEQDRGQNYVRFSPKIAGTHILKKAREVWGQYEGEWAREVRETTVAELRKQVLKTSGTSQETDTIMAHRVGRVHAGEHW